MLSCLSLEVLKTAFHRHIEFDGSENNFEYIECSTLLREPIELSSIDLTLSIFKIFDDPRELSSFGKMHFIHPHIDLTECEKIKFGLSSINSVIDKLRVGHFQIRIELDNNNYEWFAQLIKNPSFSLEKKPFIDIQTDCVCSKEVTLPLNITGIDFKMFK
jgi:hypothetical protein